MSLIKVAGHNTFEWKIDINKKFLLDWSGPFSIDGYNVEIVCDRIFCSSPTPNLYQFRLFLPDPSIFQVSYTFSILDRNGHVFVTSKGKVYKEQSERMLLNINVSYFKDCHVTENGIFTVRFSGDHELEPRKGFRRNKAKASKGAHKTKNTIATNRAALMTKDSSNNTKGASNVADSSTNTNPLATKDSSTNTDREDTNLLETLSNDFSTFYENEADTDCVLRVSDAEFHVHRAVLSARSSVFSAMFHHDTAESRSGEVNIQDVKATVLGDVLYYVYSGKIKGLTANTATSMYTAADKYDLPALRTECFEYIKYNLTMDNFCDAALLAHTHGEMELEERVVFFIEENSDEVFESNIWHQFLKDKNIIASKLLMSGFKISKNKQFRHSTSK